MFLALLERAANALPSECAVCRAWPAQPVCEACIARFTAVVPRCRTCAIELPAGVDQCGACLLEAPPLDACFAAVAYEHPWVERLAEFKYWAQPGWAAPLTQLLRRAPGVVQAVSHCDLVVPMPLARDRLRSRGYNQALEIARRLDARKTDARLLLRVRETPPQNVLDRKARERNVAGAFAVEPLRIEAVRERRIVLVDDIMTSGASLFAAASALRVAGAARVAAVVFARTPQPTLAID